MSIQGDALPSAVDAFIDGYREAEKNSLPDSCEWHGGEGSSGPGCRECEEESR